MIAASDLRSILETAHLLRSKKNAERLFTALNRAVTGKRKTASIEWLRKELGIERKEESA